MTTAIKILSKTLVTAIAATLAITLAAPAVQAAEPAAVLTKVVAYGDLDVNSPMGAQVLYARVRSAAREVCQPLEGRDLKTKLAWRQCYDSALNGAVRGIHQPALTALYNQTNQHVGRSADSG